MRSEVNRRSVLQTAGMTIVGLIAGCSTTSRLERSSKTQENETQTTTTCRSLTGEHPSTENGVWFALVFSGTVTDDQGRAVTVQCDQMVLRGGTGHEIATYDIGVPEEEPEFVRGAYAPEQSENRTYRWFGKEVVVQFPKFDAGFDAYSQVDIVAKPATTDPSLSATLYAKNSATYRFDRPGWHSYPVTLHGERECQR